LNRKGNEFIDACGGRMKVIEKLTPGMWVSIPNVDEPRAESSWPPDELIWAWYLSLDEGSARDMLVISSRPSSLWKDTKIVTALINGRLTELHVRDNSHFGDKFIFP
jgi:hypothetical protein